MKRKRSKGVDSGLNKRTIGAGVKRTQSLSNAGVKNVRKNMKGKVR